MRDLHLCLLPAELAVLFGNSAVKAGGGSVDDGAAADSDIEFDLDEVASADRGGARAGMAGEVRGHGSRGNDGMACVAGGVVREQLTADKTKVKRRITRDSKTKTAAGERGMRGLKSKKRFHRGDAEDLQSATCSQRLAVSDLQSADALRASANTIFKRGNRLQMKWLGRWPINHRNNAAD